MSYDTFTLLLSFHVPLHVQSQKAKKENDPVSALQSDDHAKAKPNQNEHI